MDAKTYREKDERIPFQEDVNVNLFFPGAQRRELVDDVLAALRDGVTFLSISGEEGTGKTMICRMVEKEIADNYLCVYIPDNLESFDDVVAVVAKAVGLDSRENQKEAADREHALRLFLSEKKQRLVVIFDNAEKMYLAMLERLRKQLDRMNSEETLLQMILAGRRLLYENLEQLEICEFEEIEEVHFHLSALEQSETHAYLNHCAKLRSRKMGKCMFSSGAAKKIFSLGRGNLKVTNMLAAKAIASADAEDSFVVHPKNVIVGDEPAFPGKGRFQLFSLFSMTAKRNWIIAGAGIVALAVILFVLMRGEGEEEKTILPEQENQAMTAMVGKDEAADPGEVESSRLDIQNKNANQDETVVPKEEDSLFVVETAKEDAVVKQAEKKLSVAAKPEETEAEQLPALSGNGSDQSKNQQIKREIVSADSLADKDSAMDNVTDELKSKASPTAADGVRRKDAASTVGKQPENQSEDQINQTKSSAEKKTTGQVMVSQLKVEEHMDKTIADANQNQEKQEVHQQETIDQENGRQEKETGGGNGNNAEEGDSPVLSDTSKTIPIKMANIAEPKQIHQIAPVKFSSQSAEPSPKTKENTAAADIPADILYQQRVSAGRQMLSREQSNYQTIQLMALSAGKAEENLQSRLTRKEYRAIAENLYIVKSMDNSMVFVYYGQFPDEVAAQQARKMLPDFLRKNSPYVISLEDARRKTNFHQ